jgi:sulfur-oxidizing protein SoxY
MSIDIKRRLFLKGSVAASAVGAAIGVGVLTPGQVLAAWPKEAFDNKDMAASMESLLGMSGPEDSAEIEIKAPEIAENGAVVPVTVSTEMEGVESVTIYAPNNPSPLIANFVMGAGAMGYCQTRIKMGKTGDVIGVVKAGGKLYKAAKEVKVTIGGCGG